MSVRDYSLTLDGTVQNLSDVLPVNQGDSLKFISIQADAGNTGVVYIGSTNRGSGDDNEGVLSTTKYGWRIEIPVSSIPNAPSIVELSQNGISLAELSVIGTNTDVIHIFFIR